ncbi:SusE domain-containing protein [Natronogracilivirga saccharolytica]|uniref:SusE domain-containing protein n=1 Tax=Natronogracilivirga saccharolytica TaxID=2812953 RepID=A0A8J7S357_9BACT|nr:SusE domain-containing protein [Natronogracilivirga saccharolytica]MBP3191203.1 SusE domain-containing protein [Natronogracilivirga saccharolytica]
MSSSPDAPSITSDMEGQSFQLLEDEADEILFTLEWTAADYGYDAAVEYEVQISETGDNFENYNELGSTAETEISFTVGEVNSELIAMGFDDTQDAEVQIRVIAKVDGAEVDEEVSEPVSLMIRPYLVEIELPEIYVPGGYQDVSGYGNEWSPEDAPPLFSFDDDDVYTGYVYIAEDDSEYKFTYERSWDLNWGDDEGDGTLDEDGANIPADAGYYLMEVDLNDETYSVLDTEWGIVGDATPGDWDGDTMLEYDMEEKVWAVDVDLVEGEMKFRANQTWDDLDYGDNTGDGTLDEGGENIPVEEAGNYTVILNLGEAPFSYELIMN